MPEQCMLALPGVWLRGAYVAALLFPFLWWFSGGGWLALGATAAVLFGMLCDREVEFFLAWCDPHPITQCVITTLIACAGLGHKPYILRDEVPFSLMASRSPQPIFHIIPVLHVWLQSLQTPHIDICKCCRAAVAQLRWLVVNWASILAHGITILVGGALFALYRIARTCRERLRADSAPPGMDARDVPAGATGEVRRVLLAATHYDVLEVRLTA